VLLVNPVHGRRCFFQPPASDYQKREAVVKKMSSAGKQKSTKFKTTLSLAKWTVMPGLSLVTHLEYGMMLGFVRDVVCPGDLFHVLSD